MGRCDGGRLGNFSSSCYLKNKNEVGSKVGLNSGRRVRGRISEERTWEIVIKGSGRPCTYRMLPGCSEVCLRFVVLSLTWYQAVYQCVFLLPLSGIQVQVWNSPRFVFHQVVLMVWYHIHIAHGKTRCTESLKTPQKKYTGHELFTLQEVIYFQRICHFLGIILFPLDFEFLFSKTFIPGEVT